MAPIRQAPPPLPLGGWFPPHHERLVRLCDPDALAGQTVALDWDNTCVFGDVGDAALVYQLTQKPWGVAPADLLALGRDALAALPPAPFAALFEDILAACRALTADAAGSQAPAPARIPTEAQQDLQSKLLLFYQLGCRHAPGALYAFAAALLDAGLKSCPALCQHILAAHQLPQLSTRTFISATAGAAGHVRAEVATGLAPFAEMAALVRALGRCGARPYVISASHQRLVRAAAALFAFDIPPDQILGMRPQAMARGEYPATYGAGKSEVIRRYLPQPPVLVGGDAMTDLDMLVSFEQTQVRLFLNRPTGSRALALLRQAPAAPGCVTLVQGHDGRTGRFNGQEACTGYAPRPAAL